MRIPEGMLLGTAVMVTISTVVFIVYPWSTQAFYLLIGTGIVGGGAAGALSVVTHVPVPPKENV